MYDARAISNFFIERALDMRQSMSVMTLLKVLYFSHGWHLVKYGAPLVAQPFEAWKHGPVNRIVYDQLKHLKAKPVNLKLISFDPELNEFAETRYDLDAERSKFLRDIFDYYSKFHAFRLSDLTHEPESPWDRIWRKAESEAVPGMIIPNELIKDWFAKSGERRSLSLEGRTH